jgi:dedicator of cytokinesis protein 1
METTNNAIKDIIISHRNDPNLPINPLSMKISGIVDAAVMGGFAKYEEAFLTDLYVDQNPRDRTLVEKLKDLIASQIPLLEIGECDYKLKKNFLINQIQLSAISVHRSKAPANLMPFQERLEKCFNEMQISVETKYGKRVIGEWVYVQNSLSYISLSLADQ